MEALAVPGPGTTTQRADTGGCVTDRIALLLRWAILLGVAGYLALYISVAMIRLRYPFELEWMEGAVVDHARRILAGRPLYGPPSIDFVPYIYTPLYFYVGALMSRLTGVGFFPLRLVSFLASLGCFLVIGRLVARETKNAFAGFAAAGLFAATYRLSGCWFDLARVDSLLLLLLLLVVYVVRFLPRPVPLALASVLAWFAFLTKQSGAAMIAPVLAITVVSAGRRSLSLIGAALGCFLGGNWLLNRLFHGWFNYYVFSLPRAKTVIRWRIAGFWFVDLLPSLFIAMLVSAVYLGYELARGDRERGRFLAFLVVGLVGGSWLFRLYSGVYYNALMPAHAAIAILFGLALGRAQAVRWLRLGLYAACLAQFALLVHHPTRLLPSARDRQAGERLIATIAAIPGDVYLPEHGYLAALAGKRTYAHGLAMRDVTRGDPGPAARRMNADLQRAIETQRFAAWVLENKAAGDFLTGYYVERDAIFARRDVFWPVTGMHTRPEKLFLPVKRK